MDLAGLFYKELRKIIFQFDESEDQALKALYQFFQAYLHEITSREKIAFTTIFARIRYAAEVYSFPDALYRSFQVYRRTGHPSFPHSFYDPFDLLVLGSNLLYRSIQLVYEAPQDDFLETFFSKHPIPPIQLPPDDAENTSYRVLLTGIDAHTSLLQGLIDDDTGAEVSIKYNVPGKNDLFNPAIKLLQEHLTFPVQVYLHGVHREETNILVPEVIVLEPDYLIDVSVIASCFRSSGVSLPGYLLKKYLPYKMTLPLLQGNIANYFLDELIKAPEKTFAQLLPGIFRLFPLELALLTDQEVKTLIAKSEMHFQHLRKVIEIDFPRLQVHPANCIIEPSFFSATYGIQGRLDLLYLDPLDTERRVIIELKSGRQYNASIYGINQDHLIQTLLYDLLIQAVYGKDQQAENYILYSALETQQLYKAPRLSAQQYDALQVRNRLIALEFALAALGTDPNETLLEAGNRFFNKWRTEKFPAFAGFERENLLSFEKAYEGMTTLLKKYFIAFSGFIAREQILAKKGLEGIDQARGQAALWLNFPSDKEAAFMIFQRLKLQPEAGEEDAQILHFQRSPQTSKLANFRIGDIAILYPSVEDGQKIEASQVFKCTVAAVEPERVTVRLRYPQADLSKYEYWSLEPDMIDSSFLSLSRGLFEFANAAPHFQQLIMGEIPPEKGTANAKKLIPTEIPGRQAMVLEKALQAKDYFLLWGPPGTGKTSVFLRQLADILMNQTAENVLLMAYTNRAVDEICEAVEASGLTDYLRIGSEYSCDPRFRDRLFSVHLADINTRRDLLGLLHEKRLFVGTLASLSNNMDLFRIKKFHTAIIDEASQILEPMLAGILSRFDRFFLIGDHHQLPAVVMQSEAESAVHDPDLRERGLSNLRNSLFERLYRRAIVENWDHAFAMLQHQGRMHHELMDFPGRVFYEGNLAVLPSETDSQGRQRQGAWLKEGAVLPEWQEHPVFCRRRLYIPTRAEWHAGGLKANVGEAKQVADLLFLLDKGLTKTQLLSVGIITPYRAQIALIRQKITDRGMDPDLYTIDTVERYQGGARDVIILSLCTNTLFQFRQVAQVSADGVDRKLNVALTRAREQLIMLGDPDILQQMPFYSEWIQEAFTIEAIQGI